MRKLDYGEYQMTETQAEVFLKMVEDGYTNPEKTITARSIESTYKYHRTNLMPQIEKLVSYGIFGKVEQTNKTGYYVTEFGRFTAILTLYDSDIGKTKDSDLLEFFPLIKKHLAEHDSVNKRYVFRILGENLLNESRFSSVEGFTLRCFSLPLQDTQLVFRICNTPLITEDVMPEIQEISTAYFFLRLNTPTNVFVSHKDVKFDPDVKACIDSVLGKLDSDLKFLRTLIK